jgi:hypothetical protein
MAIVPISAFNFDRRVLVFQALHDLGLLHDDALHRVADDAGANGWTVANDATWLKTKKRLLILFRPLFKCTFKKTISYNT